MAFAETANLAVKLSLGGNFVSQMGKAQKSLTNFDKGVQRVGKGAGQIGSGFARAGLIAGGAVVTGLAGAAKAAIDFQDAFAGVKKTVAGTPAEMRELDDALRKLSTRVPINYTDLAGIAAEAGALGVPTKEVAGFTEVVARLSAATVGLTTEAAAEAFGKLGNVLSLHGKDFERAGSALVALGNAGASSEGDIVEVAKRFGAAGAQAKLSAAEVLGFSSAIASMGVEPEAAGSSLSRLFNNITKYIGTGSKKINAFAAVSGKSVKEFSKLFAKDASGAVQLFLTQLSKMDRFKAAAALKAAGITNVRDINAVLLLARGHKELKRQVDLSTDAYKKNTELAEVSKERFDTLKAKIIELKNAFILGGVTLADGFLPALTRSVTKLQTFLAVDSNRSELKSIGEDIGKAIDGIEWDNVIKGGKDFLGVMKIAVDYAKRLFDVLNALPTEIKAAGLGLLTLNKLSGGLIGSGVGNIVGGIGESIVRSLGSKIPGIGGAFVQPVFVTNMPIGGLGGGLPGLAAGAAGIGGAAAAGIAGIGVGAAIVGAVNSPLWVRNTTLNTKLEEQGLTQAERAAQQYYTASASDQAQIRKHILVMPTVADFASGNAKLAAAIRNRSGSPDDRDAAKNRSGSPDDRNKTSTRGIITLGRKVDTGNAQTRKELTSSKAAIVAAQREDARTAREGLSNVRSTTSSGLSSVRSATTSGASSIVGAIRSNRPITNVSVNVSATTIQQKTVVTTRYGGTSGDRNNGSGLSPGGK